MTRLEWVEAYMQSFGADAPGSLRIVAVENQGRLDAVVPLISHRTMGAHRLESLGVRELYEPTDVLCRSEEALDRALFALLQASLPVAFERLPLEVSATLSRLQAVAKDRALVVTRPRTRAPTVVLGNRDPEQILNAGRRSDLRRALRRAERLGDVSTSIALPTAGELSYAFDSALALEASGWKARRGEALAQMHPTRAFFEQFARRAQASGILRFAFMRIGSRPVAMQMAVECGEALWLLKIGYDEAFADCSPGQILMQEVIRYASGRGLRAIELLGNAAP